MRVRRAPVRWLAAAFGSAFALAACSLLVSPNDYVGARPGPFADAGLAEASVDAKADDNALANIPGPLFVYYRFEGNAFDSSGNGRDGLQGGATSSVDAGGVVGSALACMTQGDRVLIGGDFRPGTSSFTLALFYRVAMIDGGAARTYNSLLVKGSAWEDSTNTSPGLGLGYNDLDHNVEGFIRDGITGHTWVVTHAAASASVPLRDGNFHHLALVVDRDASPAQVSLYVDGVIRDLTNIPAGYGPVDSTDTGKLCTEAASQIELDGALDEVMIVSRALAAGEIVALAARR